MSIHPKLWTFTPATHPAQMRSILTIWSAMFFSQHLLALIFFSPLIISSLDRAAELGVLCVKDNLCSFVYLFIHTFIKYRSCYVLCSVLGVPAMDKKHTLPLWPLTDRKGCTSVWSCPHRLATGIVHALFFWTLKCLICLIFTKLVLPWWTHPFESCPCCCLSAWMSLPLPSN